MRFLLGWWLRTREVRRLRAEVRALQAQVSAHLSQLAVERIRQRQREEELLDRCLQAVQLNSLSKTPLTVAEKAVLPPTPNKRLLSDFEQQEREMWGIFAEEAGQPKQDGYARWDRERGDA